MEPILRTFADPGADLQAPFDAAVVMPTILRPSLARALASVYAQDAAGRVQVLLGLDRPGDPALLDAACAGRPTNIVVQALWPGYSTSVRHGGLSLARDGGALRCLLSHLANSPFVAYLDDDNWWGPRHLSSLRAAIQAGADWAYGLRWFVHPETARPVAIDRWESVGPGRGVFAERFGGFADPNTVMIDKRLCEAALAQWTRPLPGDAKGMSADRNVFAALRARHAAATDQATAFYVLDPRDDMHPFRLRCLGDAYQQAGA